MKGNGHGVRGIFFLRGSIRTYSVATLTRPMNKDIHKIQNSLERDEIETRRHDEWTQYRMKFEAVCWRNDRAVDYTHRFQYGASQCATAG